MKNIILAIIICITSASFVQASDTTMKGNIYKTNGELADSKAYIEMLPKQFKTKAEAEAVASTLENGQVFIDYDHNLYQVWYGNVLITGVVVTSTVSES